YAHHPEELRACIRSARDLYPGKKITGIFQPHLFTRTRDFADGFAESLSMLDELLLMEIYPARESPIPGVTSAMLIDKITTPLKKLCSPEQVLDHIRSNKPEVLLTLGAGDIDQLVMPIRTLLEKKS
ncbi:MAG: glutamate ligase domain-containing protein, partial [Bacteroidota bacterium]